MGISKFFYAKESLHNLHQNSDLLKPIQGDDLKKLQVVFINMYDDIFAVCEKYDIKPMLIYGTAIGAVRHGGFIPWDDDLDLLMTRNDFEKFKMIAEKELGKKYDFSSPNYQKPAMWHFGKIRKKGTVLLDIAHLNTNMPTGVDIDIFILENMKVNKYTRPIKSFVTRMLVLVLDSVYGVENNSMTLRNLMRSDKHLSFIYRFRRIIGHLFHFFSYQKWANIFDDFVNESSVTGFVNIPTGGKYGYSWKGHPLEMFLPAIPYSFEGRKAYMPNKYDEILKSIYGNYMEIPPVEKREKHYIVEFSAEHERTVPLQ